MSEPEAGRGGPSGAAAGGKVGGDPLAPAFETGVLAILRGLEPGSAEEIGHALLRAGVRALEVPLNRPGALESIARLVRLCAGRASVGAGTVLDPDQVRAVAEAGGRFAVMPHGDPAILRACGAAGLACVPGVATPTEAFAALSHGAAALKLFPAQALPPSVVAAWRAVLPPEARLIAVGGVRRQEMGAYVGVGVGCVGVGSGLFRPGTSAAEVETRARAWIATARNAIGA